MQSSRFLQRVTRKLAVIARGCFQCKLDGFLNDVSGVIHIGANLGQERDTYAGHGLRVLWIEPIPDVYEELSKNLHGYPQQIARRYLVTDTDGQEYQFFLANNGGQSSSILEMAEHTKLWPDVKYVDSIVMKGITLPTLLQTENLQVQDYQALVLDVQGAEHLILKGAESLLRKFKYIKLEVPDFEAYKGCPTVHGLVGYLASFGFREIARSRFQKREAGCYYDIVFRRRWFRSG